MNSPPTLFQCRACKHSHPSFSYPASGVLHVSFHCCHPAWRDSGNGKLLLATVPLNQGEDIPVPCPLVPQSITALLAEIAAARDLWANHPAIDEKDDRLPWE